MKNVEIVRKDNNLKNKKGITLIALVITIVVLLILAGVTILTLTGENGLLKRASNASEATQKETATEKINFKVTNIQINTYAKEQRMPTLQEIADKFYEDDEIEYVITKEEVATTKEKIDVTGYNSIFTKLSEYPYEFEIDSTLRLASIDGVKISSSQSDNEQISTKLAEMEEKMASLEKKINDLNVSSGSFQLEELGTSSTTSWNEVKIEDGISQYRYLYFVLGSKAEVYATHFMDINEFKENYTSSSNCFQLYFYSGSKGSYAKYYYYDDNTIYLMPTAYACRVYGVK